MQKCGNVHAAIEPLVCGRTQWDWCVQGAGTLGEWRELLGLRFPVDMVSKACDRERDARGR